MATTETSSNGQIQDEQIKELMSTLPRRKCLGGLYLYKYKDCWFTSEPVHNLIASQILFEAKKNDVLLATTPKSGTTWLKALLFTLLNRKNFPINQNHPLLQQNPHALVPFLELSPRNDVPDFGASVRLSSTHLPLVLLTGAVLCSDNCKIVYLCRNLKDVFVSYWQFIRKSSRSDSDTSLEEIFESFCEGISLYGPVWDHILGYWKESLEKPNKVMFLRYEEMKEEPAFQLKRMAEFVGSPISRQEEEDGLVNEILKFCSFDNLSNLEVNKEGKWWIVNNHAFFRKGEVGDWKNYLTIEMGERIDQITAHKFHGSGLKFY